MKFALMLTLVGAVSAVPFALNNGFPNPNQKALQAIQIEAGGTLPNTALPTKLQDNAVQAFQVIAANEFFETAYFTSLLYNVTHDLPGYRDLSGFSKDYVVKSLTAIRAQEELHAIGANAILASAGAKTIGPCEYKFPVKDFRGAIALAATFTDLVLGTLQEVQQALAVGGGQGAQELVHLLASIIGQEGQQDGAYRLIQKKVPSAAPFLTASSGALAFNALRQTFIIDGSCAASSNMSTLNIPSFQPLSLVTGKALSTIKPRTLTFSTPYTGDASHIAYISGQNKPVVRTIKSVRRAGGKMTFKVDFPFHEGFSSGLTIAALVKSSGNATPAAVAEATVAGPGLIEV